MFKRWSVARIRMLAALSILAFAASSSGLTSEVHASTIVSTPAGDATLKSGEDVSLLQAVVVGAAVGASGGAVRGIIGLPDAVAAGAALGFIAGAVGGAVGWAMNQQFGVGGCSGDPSGCDVAPRGLPENVLDLR
jgi:hypothetical protein